MRKSGWFSVMQGVSYLTQVGLSIATPLVLTLLAASWLIEHAGVGAWVYVPALVLGLGAGGCSFIGFARYVARKNADKPASADAPVYVPPVEATPKKAAPQQKRGERKQ